MRSTLYAKQMKTTLQIIEELRVDCAALMGLIIAMQKMRPFNKDQSKAIESTRQGLKFIQVEHFARLRLACGDEKGRKLEEIDRPIIPQNVSVNPATVLAEICDRAKELQLKLLEIPGDNGCDDTQSNIIKKLIEGFSDWRGHELGELKNAFE